MLIEFEGQTELSIIRLDSLLERLEQFQNIVPRECRLSKDTHDFEDRSPDFEIVFNDCNEAVGDDGHVYLYADCIFGLTPKSLNLKVLFNPFEKQFHLPSIFIEQGNVLCSEVEVVRVIDETSMKFWCIKDNPSDSTGILLLILLSCETNRLVFKYIVNPIENALTIDNFICRLTFLPDDEERTEHVNSIKSGEVKVTSIKYIARKRLICKPVHRVDIVHFGIRDSIEYGYLRGNVNLGMDSDTRLRAPELCPSEYRHT